jgi:hypothetical protein
MTILTRSQLKRRLQRDHIIGYKLIYLEPSSIVGYIYNQTNERFGIATLKIDRSSKNNLNRLPTKSYYAKYRAESAEIIDITDITGNYHYTKGYSAIMTGGFYNLGEVIRADKWSDDENDICSNGIHFFLSRDAVLSYKNMLDIHPFNYKLTNNITINCINRTQSVSNITNDDGIIEAVAYYDSSGFLTKIENIIKKYTRFIRIVKKEDRYYLFVKHGYRTRLSNDGWACIKSYQP